MGYNKLGDMFEELLSKKNFSSRTRDKLNRFVSELNSNVKNEDDLRDIVNSANLLKSLLKKEGILNSEFDNIINNISKKL